jgi:hypothetical protein
MVSMHKGQFNLEKTGSPAIRDSGIGTFIIVGLIINILKGVVK